MAQRGSNGTARSTAILRGYLARLTSIISTSPVVIAMELTVRGVIGFEVFDQVQSVPAPSFDRSTTIVTAVYRKVQAEGDEALRMFLEVLKKRQECAGLALSIEREWRSHSSCRWCYYVAGYTHAVEAGHMLFAGMIFL